MDGSPQPQQPPAACRPQHKLSLIKRGFDFFWAVFKNNSLEFGPYGPLLVHSPWAKLKNNTLELSPYALRADTLFGWMY